MFPSPKEASVYKSIAGVVADIILKHIHNSHVKGTGRACVGGLAGEMRVPQYYKRESS